MFYDNPLLGSFTADIKNMVEKENLYYVTLDKTAFFYGGGGQPKDIGTINNIKVVDVFWMRDRIVHVLNDKPNSFEGLGCRIDLEYRFDYMQQHLAQHIISGCFYNMFSKNTQGIHLGEQTSTVDINGSLTNDEVLSVERLANKVIQENLEVQSFVPQLWEIRRLNLRRDLPVADKKIRILKIGDFDVNACCGLHFKNTLSVVFIKIKNFERYKGNTRVEFLAGKRATDYVLQRDFYFDEICRHFNTDSTNAINAINNLEAKISSYAEDNKSVNQKYINYKFDEVLKNVDVISNLNIYKHVFDEKPMLIRKISEKVVKNSNDNICLFANRDDNNIMFIFASSENVKIDMAIVLRQLMQKINGKGGGNRHLAQGAVNAADIELSFDYAVEIILNSI